MKTLIAFSMLVVACSTQGAVVPSANLVASKNFPFVPTYPWAPTMRLDITYMNQQIMFTHCCRNYSYYARYDKIQPAENPFVRKPVEKRHQPIEVTFAYQNKTRPYLWTNYTLLMVDPDVPFATAGTRDKPLLHWLVHNLNLFYPSGNTTIYPYRGPAPPDQKPHNYVFLLYEQGRSSTPMNINTVNNNASRFLFDVNRFVRTFNLTLVGISWFEAANDPYTNYTKVLRDPTTAGMYCTGATGWTPHGCVKYTMGANMLGMTLALFFVPIVVMVKFVV